VGKARSRPGWPRSPIATFSSVFGSSIRYPAWHPTRNRLSRLNAAPKHQLVDPALAAVLLGALFESLVTQSVRVYAQNAEARVGHLRTFAGNQEVDLIVERADGRILAIEVKLAQMVEDEDVRHLRWLEEKIGDELLDTLVITTGTAAYRREDGIGVVPASLLSERK
jgi:uncharacterized protein